MTISRLTKNAVQLIFNNKLHFKGNYDIKTKKVEDSLVTKIYCTWRTPKEFAQNK